MTFDQRCLAALVTLASSVMVLGCSSDDALHTVVGVESDDDPVTADAGSVTSSDDAGQPDASTITQNPPPMAEEDDLGLLGSSHARSYMDIFCEGKADQATL